MHRLQIMWALLRYFCSASCWRPHGASPRYRGSLRSARCFRAQSTLSAVADFSSGMASRAVWERFLARRLSNRLRRRSVGAKDRWAPVWPQGSLPNLRESLSEQRGLLSNGGLAGVHLSSPRYLVCVIGLLFSAGCGASPASRGATVATTGCPTEISMA